MRFTIGNGFTDRNFEEIRRLKMFGHIFEVFDVWSDPQKVVRKKIIWALVRVVW